MKLVGKVARNALENGQMVRLEYPPFDVLVSEYEGVVAAIEDACNHAGASLCEGDRLEGNRVNCPMHGYIFDLRSGELLAPKGLCDHQRRFTTTVEGDEVMVWEQPFRIVM